MGWDAIADYSRPYPLIAERSASHEAGENFEAQASCASNLTHLTEIKKYTTKKTDEKVKIISNYIKVQVVGDIIADH